MCTHALWNMEGIFQSYPPKKVASHFTWVGRNNRINLSICNSACIVMFAVSVGLVVMTLILYCLVDLNCGTVTSSVNNWQLFLE